MRLRNFATTVALLVISAAASTAPAGAQTAAPPKQLTVERIFAAPAVLNGQLTRGIAWSPDGKRLTYLSTTGAAKSAKTELWEMDTQTGERRQLISAEKLATALQPPNTTSQATGLARRPPPQYQWSPDGTALLFTGETQLIWFDLKSQSAKTLLAGDQQIADSKISPDGHWVSYVSDHNLFITSTTREEIRAITKSGTEEIREGELDWVYPEELQISTGYWWSPDSSAIAYLEMDERPVSKFPIQNSLGEVQETEWERYPAAGTANPIVKVFVVDLATNQPRAMDTGNNSDIYLPRVNWLPDSRQLAIQRLNRAQDTLDLLLADAKSGASHTILTEKDQYWINLHDDLHFLRDGKGFLWSSERTGYRHLYLCDLTGRQIAQLTTGDWEVTALDAVDEDSKTVYFSATEKTPLERHLYRVGLDGANFARVTQESGNHSITMSPTARAYLDTHSDAAHPPRQDLYSAVTGKKIAALNENKVSELSEYALSPVEFLQVNTHDKVQLNAMMIKPPNFDPAKKYPVIVYTYGGPHAQVVLNAWGGSTFLWHEMMAQKGFVIFAMDNRGSAGRGHVFEEPIHYRLGAQELSDQHDGVRYLRSLPFIDGANIGIWGSSYGGHMTLHALFRDPGDFKAGFAGSPVSDWKLYDTIYTERYLGDPKTRIEEYDESSPVKNATDLQGKLLLAAGTGDDNVHFANTLEVLDELISAGKYAESAIFPGRGHGISDPKARTVLFQRVTKFFEENLK